jgi:hypothetical protein
MKKLEFIIQTIDVQITSNNIHEIKENLDNDYSHLLGISISDVFCSDKSILELVKVKGVDLLPDKFEAIHIMSSKHIAPNKRFYTLFEPVETRGDEIVVRFSDPDYSDIYNLQIHLLLSNKPEDFKCD